MPARKKGPPGGLSLNLDGCRFDDSPSPPRPHSTGGEAGGPRPRLPAHLAGAALSPLGTTYRSEGLSVGRDFLRHMGRTVSEGRGMGSFDVEGLLGRGVCSAVWLARCRGEGDGGEGRRYALKQFEMRDGRRRDMLRRELDLLCSFRCGCLVGLEGAHLDGGDGGTVTLVLEYMDRGSLADLTAAAGGEDGAGGGGPVLDGTVAAAGYQVLRGLSFLHREGVLHRDVKPANVLVSSSGHVKLADFGIASARRDGPPGGPGGPAAPLDDTVMSRTVVGTTRYMSPERLRGGTYTRQCDVWGAGLVLLELRRGDSPFEDVASLVELVQTLDECRMGDFVPDGADEGLREILVACLQQSPEKRIPAPILLASPWFGRHRIGGVDDAAARMREYLLTHHDEKGI